MESLPANPPYSYLSSFDQNESVEEQAGNPNVVHAHRFIPDISSALSPVQITSLPDRQTSTWPVQKFVSPDIYEMQARANMRAFLEKNSYRNNHLISSHEAPLTTWLSVEQVSILNQSREGMGLLKLINELDQLATICTGKKRKHSTEAFKKPDYLPFDFDTNLDNLLKKTMFFLRKPLVIAMGTSPPSIYWVKKQGPNLTDIEIINYTRLLVKIANYQLRDNKTKFEIKQQSVFLDFIITSELISDATLLNLAPQAFREWIDMQLALRRLIFSNFISLGNIEIIRSINRFIWSFEEDNIAPTEQIKINQNLILDYTKLFLIPSQVLPLLFQKPSTDTSELTFSSVEAVNPSLFPKKITAELFTFGEEFEFLSVTGEDIDEKEADKILKEWRAKLEQALNNKDITDFSITPAYAKNQRLKSLDIRIGNWNYRIYYDDNVLEVNTTPYYLDQYFTVQSQTMKTYQLFDLFVLNIARDLHLPTRSGHKHIGIDKALHGNSEILLRLLLDVEKRAWFPRIFLREQRSYDQFQYMAQNTSTGRFVLEALVESFNRQLKIDPERKKNESFNSIKQLVEMLQTLNLWRGKVVPLNLQHLYGNIGEGEREGVRNACTTIEFRFPQAARSGEEAKRLNQILVAWLCLMEKHQRSNTPLQLELNNPMDYALKEDEEIMRLFHNFVQELELDWDTFKSCSFLKNAPTERVTQKRYQDELNSPPPIKRHKIQPPSRN